MRVSLRVEADITEEVEVRPLENLLFELTETPLVAYPEACLGDIVRLRQVEGDLYEVEEVVERPYAHWDFLIPGTYGASQSIHDFGNWVISRGGRWECVACGLLFIHLPAGEAIEEVASELKARIERFAGSEEHARLLESGPPGLPRPGSDVRMGELRIERSQREDKEEA